METASYEYFKLLTEYILSGNDTGFKPVTGQFTLGADCPA